MFNTRPGFMAPTTPCRRPRQAPAAAASQAAVWITDNMLRQAIDQYQRRFLVTNRPLSSHKSLHELRRRPLGQRTMADMMASEAPYRPTWWFELMGNKNAWQWQSPTTPHHRREKESKPTFSSVVDKFIAWLEDSDLDQPFLEPPTEAVSQAGVRGATQEATGVISTARSIPRDILAEFACLKADINAMDSIDDRSLDKLLGKCNRALRNRLELGDFTAEHVCAALKPLESQSFDSRLSEEQVRILTRFTSSTIIGTIAASRRYFGGKLYDEAWEALVNKVFDMAPGTSRFRLFGYIMQVATPADVEKMSDFQLAQIIEEFMCSHGDSFHRHAVLSTWTIRTALFSRAVNRLPEARLSAILEDIQASIVPESQPRSHQMTWLLMNAYLSHTTNESLAKMTTQYQTKTAAREWRLTASDIWRLSVGRMVAEGTLEWQSAFSISKTYYEHNCSRWTEFAETLLATGGTGSVKSLMAWLEDVNETRWLHRSLVFTQIEPETPEIGSRARYVMEQLIADHEICRLPLVMEVNFVRGRLLNDLGNGKGVMNRKQMRRGMLELMESLAYWYMLSPHLSDRQALRGVQWCMRSFEKMSPDGKGSQKILNVLSKILMRDMEAGQWGRTERLRWLITKIREYQGPLEAKKVVKALESWREKVHQENRRQHLTQLNDK